MSMFQLFARKATPVKASDAPNARGPRPWDAQKLAELETWVAEHKALPRQASSHPFERRLSTFAGALARHQRREGLAPDLVKRLRAMKGMPSDAWPVGWVSSCRDLAAWVGDRKRAPDRNSLDARERSVAVTLRHSSQAHRNTAVPAGILEKLRSQSSVAGATCEAWQVPDSAEDARRKRLQELERWVDSESRLPKQSAEDVAEKSLARFLAAMHRRHKAKRLSAEEVQLLEAIPGVEMRLQWGRELKERMDKGLGLPSKRRNKGKEGGEAATSAAVGAKAHGRGKSGRGGGVENGRGGRGSAGRTKGRGQ